MLMSRKRTISDSDARPRKTADCKIVVFGATGHTARFVVSELRRRGMGVVLAGRDAEKLRVLTETFKELEVRVASIGDAQSVDRALFGASLVLNCAGPYSDTAIPIVEAAIRAKIHYLDFVAGEQLAALSIFQRFDALARKCDVAVVPAAGFYGALGDLLATVAMGDWAEAEEVDVGIALDSWQPTQGTLETGKRIQHRFVLAGGQFAPLPDPAPQRVWSFPLPFGQQDVVEVPFTETILIARHLRVRDIHNFLNLTPLKDLRDPRTAPPIAADERGRSKQIFMMEAIVRKGDKKRRALAHGRDIYAVTAPIIVEAAQRILTERPRSGAFTVAELFDASSFLQSLSPEHLTFVAQPNDAVVAAD
jgi:short subunit dehydrogenase-like uncharacterized protein